jgi:hypothetical protein
VEVLETIESTGGYTAVTAQSNKLRRELTRTEDAHLLLLLVLGTNLWALDSLLPGYIAQDARAA